MLLSQLTFSAYSKIHALLPLYITKQQRVAVGPENGGNSFLVAMWRLPQATACRVRLRFCYGRCRGRRPYVLRPLLLLLLPVLLLYSQFGD